MDIDITNILVETNPRTDFAKLDELAASMKEKGLITPIVVEPTDNGKFKLIAGERRLRAAKLLNWPTIPASELTCLTENKLELQLIENIQRESLNPVEEGLAFKRIMKEKKLNTKQVAQDIGKTELFVKRRTEILTLPKEVLEALKTGRIKLGHALVMLKIPTKTEQKELLKRVVSNKISVRDAVNSLRYGYRMLSRAEFSKEGCKGCTFNGGEQSLLIDGSAEIKGNCINTKCFDNKEREWLNAKVKEYRDAGVKILTPEEWNNTPHENVIRHWDSNHKKALKDLKIHPEKYAVFIDSDGDIEITLLTKKGTTTAGKGKASVSQLANKINDYQRKFLIRKGREKLAPSTRLSKGIALYFLIRESSGTNQTAALKEIGTKGTIWWNISRTALLKKIIELKEEKLDELLNFQSQIRVKDLYDETLELLLKTQKLKMKKEFTVNESYLNLHTIAQLPTIAEELGVTVSKGKKTDMIKEILKQDLKGKVPKAMKLK